MNQHLARRDTDRSYRLLPLLCFLLLAICCRLRRGDERQLTRTGGDCHAASRDSGAADRRTPDCRASDGHTADDRAGDHQHRRGPAHGHRPDGDHAAANRDDGEAESDERALGRAGRQPRRRSRRPDGTTIVVPGVTPTPAAQPFPIDVGQDARSELTTFFNAFYKARTLVPGGQFDFQTTRALTAAPYQEYTVSLLQNDADDAAARKLLLVTLQRDQRPTQQLPGQRRDRHRTRHRDPHDECHARHRRAGPADGDLPVPPAPHAARPDARRLGRLRLLQPRRECLGLRS